MIKFRDQWLVEIKGWIWEILLRFALVIAPLMAGAMITWGTWATLGILANQASAAAAQTKDAAAIDREAAATERAAIRVEIQAMKYNRQEIDRLASEMEKNRDKLDLVLDELRKLQRPEGGGP